MDLDQADDDIDTWERFTCSNNAMRPTCHTTLQATPAQLVFRQDSILNIQFDANWKLIKACEQAMIKRNNQMEHARCKPHKYGVGDKVLLVDDGTREAKVGKRTMVWSL